jgi:hypothetical protein
VRSRPLVAVLLTLGHMSFVVAAASAEQGTSDGATAVASRVAGPAAKLTAPSQVTEGDRYTVRIKLQRPSLLRRVHVQHRVADVFGDRSWQTVKTLKPRSGNRLSYRTVAGDTDREIFRVLLQPRSGRSVTSKPVPVDVWHWYPLTTFDSYYATAGVADYNGNQFAMNGRTYTGSWYTYGTARSWESRYTLGRKCTNMSGTFGLTDSSADGSSATVQVLAEGVEPIYTSPTLAPGAVDTRLTPLASPYRISILGTNTSPDKVLAYPAAGDLQFLCHGLE